MPIHVYRYLLLIAVLYTGYRGYAQPVQYQFSQLNISNGLSHNQINSIFKDRKGFMWFGTMSGLNRYDGYTFRIFRHDQKDTASINDDNILNIQQGPYNNLWIQTRAGFVIYDPIKETFNRNTGHFLHQINISGTLSDIRDDRKGNYWIVTDVGLYRFRQETGKAVLVKTAEGLPITSLAVTKAGDVWLARNNGLLEQVSSATNAVVFSMKALQVSSPALCRLFADSDGDIWMYCTDQPRGICYISMSENAKEYFTKEAGRFRLNTNIIYSICQDDKGLIWVGTDHGGINLLNKKSGKVTYLLNREADGKSLAQNSTPVLYRDDTGIMWAGTFKRGISYYHESIIKFPLYRHYPSIAGSISYEDVNRFAEDARGNLWIGTNGGGLICFNRQNNSFQVFRHEAGNDNSLSNDVIVSLWIDHEQKLWIGTYFGGLDCFDGNRFIHYRHDGAVRTSLSDDRVWEIMEDADHNLWIGTLAGGLNLFDRRSKTFSHFRAGQPNSVRSDYIAALLEDTGGNVWVGTDIGIDVWIKKERKFIHYTPSNDGSGLSSGYVISMLQDSRGLIWIGTQDGLNVFEPKQKRFRVIRTTEGLPDNTILNILEDHHHNLWVSTPNGISNIILTPSGMVTACKNYDEMDGLQGREFNENAALRTSRGELIFGGANGFNMFHPDQIITNSQTPALVLTDFHLFNRSIRPGETDRGRVVLPYSIAGTSEIVLNYNQNIFSIEFAALNFSNAARNTYSYILEGFNGSWLTADPKTRRATFTNLDPGEYTFRVRAANDAGGWSNKGIAVKIRILPPFWKTPLAYIMYGFIAVGILFYIRYRGIRTLRAQFAIEQERHAARQMHELDMMKIRFFTNVSHEFRTPLSLILAPLDKLLKHADNAEAARHLQLIGRNARRLLNLVNQLMDFRKMEVNELTLQAEEGDIIAFIKENFFSFTDLAEKKNISFSIRSDVGSLNAVFDRDKLERILFNLLSNAFKFTPEGGRIAVELSLNVYEGSQFLRMDISDSGIGISADKQEKIFERFFQSDVPGSMVNQGSGIGLAITREFVALHNGKIAVQSTPGEGSSFSVELPVEASGNRGIGFYSEEKQPAGKEPEHHPVHPGRAQGPSKKHTVLLIEDNDDFRFYLKDNLRQYYHIEEASDGKTGWSKTLSAHPDLIVSDISMPGMNGIDLCLKIRSDKRTNDIPVILLTAMTGEEQLLRGLETGANDYMTKPFNFEVLLSKIRNLIVRQESLRKTYQKQIEVKASDIEVVSADEKFMQQALLVVEKNISNTGFSVEEFSREMCMSRVALYKKLLQLTRQTPIEFIRGIRLKRAVQLLEKSQFTVSEIAYEVGFNNPKYFARYFKAEYGVLPSAWGKVQS